MDKIIFEYGFKSVNGIVKKQYSLSEIPSIQQKCDVWNELPIVYVRQYIGLTDKAGIPIFADDIRIAHDGTKFRIYHVYGGFIMKDSVWMKDLKDLNVFDDLIWTSLSEPQQAQYICESTTHYGNIHDNPELLEQPLS